MSISTAFITQTRTDLVTLSRDLAHNLIPYALDQTDQPQIWSIYGSYAAGKSLLAETVASSLTGDNIEGYFEDEPLIMGFQGAVHSYFDEHANRQYQFWDILCIHSTRTRLEREQRQKEMIPQILGIQERGGIIFLHNAPTAARDFNPAIEISITEKRKLSHIFNPLDRAMPGFDKKLLRDLNLQKDFLTAKRNTGESAMIRLVQMTIHNPDIFVPDFTKNLESGLYRSELEPC